MNFHRALSLTERHPLPVPPPLTREPTRRVGDNAGDEAWLRTASEPYLEGNLAHFGQRYRDSRRGQCGDWATAMSSIRDDRRCRPVPRIPWRRSSCRTPVAMRSLGAAAALGGLSPAHRSG